MKRLFVLVLVILFISGCVPKYTIPKADLDLADQIGKATLSKFVQHYKALHDESRPPTDEEFGYWSAKYEAINIFYLSIKSKIELQKYDINSLVRILETVFVVLL